MKKHIIFITVFFAFILISIHAVAQHGQPMLQIVKGEDGSVTVSAIEMSGDLSGGVIAFEGGSLIKKADPDAPQGESPVQGTMNPGPDLDIVPDFTNWNFNSSTYQLTVAVRVRNVGIRSSVISEN